MDNETGAFRYQDLIEGVSLGHIDTVITPSDIELWKSAHPKESADAVSQDEDGVAPYSMILALGLRGIMTLKILPPGASWSGIACASTQCFLPIRQSTSRSGSRGVGRVEDARS